MRHFMVGTVLAIVGGFWGVGHAAADITDGYVLGISGNVIELDQGRTVSLYGLQLVEISQNEEIAAAGQKYLEQLLSDSPLILQTGLFDVQQNGRNRYGDWHGKLLTAQGDWVQKSVIEKGYGWWRGAANYPPSLARDLLRAEAGARKKGAGTWKSFQILNTNAEKISVFRDDFVIAEGRVIEVFETSKTTYLNFGNDWRTDFTAAISSKNRPKFVAQGWKLSDLMNKLVTMRGKLRLYNGPYLELHFPEQLDIKEMTSE